MSQFEYLVAFESILYGLLVSKVLVSANHLLYHRRTVRFYWPHTLLLVALFIGVIQRFNARFFSPDFETVTYTYQLIFHLVIPMSLFYALFHQLFPEKSAGADLKEHLFSNIKLIFGLGFLIWMHSALDIWLATNYPTPWYYIFIYGIFWIFPIFMKVKGWYLIFISIVSALLATYSLIT